MGLFKEGGMSIIKSSRPELDEFLGWSKKAYGLNSRDYVLKWNAYSTSGAAPLHELSSHCGPPSFPRGMFVVGGKSKRAH